MPRAGARETADVVIDCTGRVETALELVATGGLLGLLGTPDPDTVLLADQLHRCGLSTVGCTNWPVTTPRATGPCAFSPNKQRIYAAAHAAVCPYRSDGEFAFAPLPASSGLAPQVASWHSVDLTGLSATIDRLLAIIAERKARGAADEFDTTAEQTLAERRTTLWRIPSLLSELPELTAQVLHGDYSPVNILFDGDELTAVIDFRPPDPFLIAYDLGRMAFYPNTVARDRAWPKAAATLIRGYLQTNPTVPAIDIRACARVALLQLLGSLYGVKQHYLKPGLFPHDLDEFWLLRHSAASTLLGHLADTDDLLAELAAAPRTGASAHCCP